jgi:hypothetical protein
MKKWIRGVLLSPCLLLLPVHAQVGTTLLEDLGTEVDLVVAQDGSGDYLTIQDAIDAVPDYAAWSL